MLVLAAMTVAGASPGAAQLQSGNLYGIITDTDGNPLPGVCVTVNGNSAPRTQKTEEKGQVRFLHLDPGRYRLVAEMDGFSRVVYEKVSIRIGRNTTVQLQMSEVLEETITVTTEPPLLDPGDLSTHVTITELELDELPMNRDPWGLLAQAPGVLSDRVNVGGSESGQQALFVGPGSSSRENRYVVDGVNITDMAAVGATPAYYDFDQLGEVRIQTGGADLRSSTAGVTLSLVTKRGTNRWRGSGRLFVTDDDWEAAPAIDRRDFAHGQDETSTNRVRGMQEHGVEAGGPLLSDRLWAWGAYSISDIDRLALGGLNDDIDLINGAVKLNLQAGSATSGVLSVNSSDKDRFGLGASLFRSPASLWNQTGGADLYALQLGRLVSSNMHVEVQASRLDSDFLLEPRGGSGSEIYLDENGIWQGSYASVFDSRDADQLRLSAARFVDGGGLAHEVEAEAQLRSFRYDGAERWGPRNLVHYSSENLAGVEGLEVVEAIRPGGERVQQDYTSGWVQDTITGEQAAVVFGLRWDVQDAVNLPGAAPAHPVFPHLLPAAVFPREEAGFTWRQLSPRFGLARSYGSRHQSQLELSYSRFPSQLYTSLAARVSPVSSAGAYFAYEDSNGNHVFDDGEQHRLLSTYGIDAGPSFGNFAASTDGTVLESANLNDRNLRPEVTDELLLAFEHSPTRKLVLGAEVIHREVSDILESRQLLRTPQGVRLAERNDFVLQEVVEGELPADRGRYEASIFTLRPELDFTGGSVLTNGDREQEYLGLSLNASRRLADGWMLRGHVTWSDWSWIVGEEFRQFDDPTDAAISFDGDLVSNVDTSGDVVAEPSRSRIDTLFLNSRWQFSVVGLVEVAPRKPWGFNVAANVHGRDGFPGPYRIVVVPNDGVRREVQITDRGDDFRFDDIVLADLRLDKDLRLGGMGMVLSLDVFNLFNSSFVLERALQLNGPQADYLLRTTSPRVFRLGLRLRWGS
jgi:hypothetical protein